MQTAYLYDEVTREFLGTKDILPDEFFDYNLPAYASWTEPTLTPDANEVLVYNASLDDWDIEDDYRGALWYLKADGSLVTFELGETPNLTTMTNIPKPSTNHQLFEWDTGNDPSLDYTFTTNVDLTGTSPLIQDGNDLTGVTSAIVLLTGQTNTAENGYYEFSDDTVNYTLTATTVWIYNLDLTREYQKRKIATDASNNIQTLLNDGVNTVLDVVAYAFALIDSFNYQAIIPDPIDYTFTTNVALSGVAPLIQDGNDLTGDIAATCKLTGQTTAEDDGYYNYVESLGNYTLTKITEPSTPFYDGVKTESGGSKSSSHDDWSGSSMGAAGYLGLFSERKRALMADIDAETDGDAILAINWVNM